MVSNSRCLVWHLNKWPGFYSLELLSIQIPAEFILQFRCATAPKMRVLNLAVEIWIWVPNMRHPDCKHFAHNVQFCTFLSLPRDSQFSVHIDHSQQTSPKTSKSICWQHVDLAEAALMPLGFDSLNVVAILGGLQKIGIFLNFNRDTVWKREYRKWPCLERGSWSTYATITNFFFSFLSVVAGSAWGCCPTLHSCLVLVGDVTASLTFRP